ncbi:MAG: TRAM domain-containing protein [Euryarchaeota archaeon]
MYNSNKSSFSSSFGSYGSGASKDSPVKVGEKHDVKIEDTARQGDGIARISGLVVFVPNTKINDSVKIEIKEIKRNCAIAEVVVVPEEVESLGQVE